MASALHVVVFPFMSKGHTIPLLHLAHLLIRRRITVTIFTTKANHPFVANFLRRHSDAVSIVNLPFPTDIEGIPEGVESTDKLPSISLFLPFATATKHMQPYFEQALQKLVHITCIVSDGFLTWTLESAKKFGVPRLSFFGMNGYVSVVSREVNVNGLLSEPESDDELITLMNFPWIKVTRNDFSEPFNERDPSGPYLDFVMETVMTTADSYGLVMNSFYELEPLFIDCMNRESKPKGYCVGPLCLAEVDIDTPLVDPGLRKPKWVEWLDQNLAQGRSVLYVAFGSQAEISKEQLEEIAKGLEDSGVSYLWVVRKSEWNQGQSQGLLDEVDSRGMMVDEWVDQREILKHESVSGFLSHCGWNSVLESVCAKVPILAWPMMAEQHLNARMVVEEIKVGLRVETCDGSVRGFVKSEGLTKTIRELMEGVKGKEVRKKVEEVGDKANMAMAEGGSSWRTLDELIDELQSVKNLAKGNGEA